MRTTRFGEHHDDLNIGELRRRPKKATRYMPTLRVPDCLPADAKVPTRAVGIQQHIEEFAIRILRKYLLLPRQAIRCEDDSALKTGRGLFNHPRYSVGLCGQGLVQVVYSHGSNKGVGDT